jgi:glycosyltransferase involved in cell wall biosynthesis
MLKEEELDAIVSFASAEGNGPGFLQFPELSQLAMRHRARWVHADRTVAKLLRQEAELVALQQATPGEETDAQLERATGAYRDWWNSLSATVERTMVATWLRWPHPSLDQPVVCAFTPTTNGGVKLRRVFNSLRAQTYDNWQWVVVVDDPSDERSIAELRAMSAADARVEYWVPQAHSGIIGTRKRQAASLCDADILVEMDHDDELMRDALAALVFAFESRPDVGFAYTDFSEPFWGSNLTQFASYGENFPLHYRIEESGAPGMPPDSTVWYLACRTRPLTEGNLWHLVSLPNHVRAWRASTYWEIGRHRNLIVGDDYEILLRTFLGTRWYYYDRMLYLQYRNVKANGGHDNFTFKRNALIQWIVSRVYEVYTESGKLHRRALELGPGQYHLEHGYRINREEGRNATIVLAARSDVHAPLALRRTVESLLVQAPLHRLLLLVDQGGVGALGLADLWLPLDDRIQVLELPKNDRYSTIAQMQARGAELSRSGIVAYAEVGHIWHPTRLQRLVDILLVDASVNIVSDYPACGENTHFSGLAFVAHSRTHFFRRSFWEGMFARNTSHAFLADTGDAHWLDDCLVSTTTDTHALSQPTTDKGEARAVARERTEPVSPSPPPAVSPSLSLSPSQPTDYSRELNILAFLLNVVFLIWNVWWSGRGRGRGGAGHHKWM